MTRLLSVAAVLSLALRASAGADSYQVNAICTCDQLMRWYDWNNGIWGSSWWESAMMMSALADLSATDSSYNGTYFNVYANTFTNAPKTQGHTNFLNNFYDDEGWWGIAWLNIYDLTQNPNYLNMAKTIFNDMHGGWTTPCGGGIYWEKGQPYIASIANELYIQLAAGLANRVPSQKSTYLGYATAGWDWFFSIDVVNADNFIVDGVDGNTCKSTGSTYTYNQGVILGAAAELYEATGNGTYLDLASKIADAVTTKGSQFLNPNGILMDGCDKTASCSGNGEEFKGPFVRNLRKLYRWVVSPTWRDFLETNAQSIWNNALNDTNSQCFVGDYWAGPYKTADAISNGIALDALNAALYATS